MNAIPSWLMFALRELGVSELQDPASNPRIDEYWRAVTDAAGLTDADAWCSAFVAWVMRQAGIGHHATAAARSWLSELSALQRPQLGCVVVLWRDHPDSWKGHVGLWMGTVGTDTMVLGGNQNNQVCIKPYPTKQLLGYRMPESA